ncbi:MAG: hypothetical protein WBE44_07005 [Terriglobales bacterium]
MTESLQQCDLDYVFRVFLIAKDPSGKTEDCVPVWHYETLEGCRIATPCASQKSLFCEFDECGLAGIYIEAFADWLD